MIETPFLRPDPSHDPVGREHPACNHRSAPVTVRTSDRDDVFQVKPGERSTEDSIGEPELTKGATNGDDNEGFWGFRKKIEALEDSSQIRTLQDGHITAVGKGHDQPEQGRSSVVHHGDTVLTQMLPVSPPSVLREGIGPSPTADTDCGKPLENHKRRCSQVDSISQTSQKEKVLKLTPERIHELTSSPQSLPLRALGSRDSQSGLSTLPPPSFDRPADSQPKSGATANGEDRDVAGTPNTTYAATERPASNVSDDSAPALGSLLPVPRPAQFARTSSNSSSIKGKRSPHFRPGTAERRDSKNTPTPLRFDDEKLAGLVPIKMEDVIPSPMPKTIPLPPMSLPTYLQLELSSHRPSPLYIHRSVTSDFPYESSRVKIERLLNFLLLPPQLEQVLWFGTVACLDAWLYTFTILPLRLLKSFYILGQSWATNLGAEIKFVSSFIYAGTGRMWKRRRTRGNSAPKVKLDVQGSAIAEQHEKQDSAHLNGSVRGINENCRASLSNRNHTHESGEKGRRHRRNKSVPSALLPDDKADILKGLLIITTCLILMRLDASRMYHWIRGQAAIKLYVIYNVLEVGDRLLSALGQDVLECLFSREALERAPDGHSKVLRPFWLFLMALAYTVSHSTALFYQVITLNVAVNSYSNALITLLMSNQFEEIKSTVFKKFEKENLFQLTCADVVERFQLWLMLLIIASRNIVETGGLGAGPGASGSSSSLFLPTTTNSSNPMNTPPAHCR
jgi:hypothetical protein